MPLLLAMVCGAAPALAIASRGRAPTAAVSLGDSYISGEAGRWQGNSISATPGNDGTDRACTGGPPCSVDTSRVYVGGTAANGCHRSDVAEILTASLPVAERVNLACSGGVTKNIFPRRKRRGRPERRGPDGAVAALRFNGPFVGLELRAAPEDPDAELDRPSSRTLVVVDLRTGGAVTRVPVKGEVPWDIGPDGALLRGRYRSEGEPRRARSSPTGFVFTPPAMRRVAHWLRCRARYPPRSCGPTG